MLYHGYDKNRFSISVLPLAEQMILHVGHFSSAVIVLLFVTTGYYKYTLLFYYAWNDTFTRFTSQMREESFTSIKLLSVSIFQWKNWYFFNSKF